MSKDDYPPRIVTWQPEFGMVTVFCNRTQANRLGQCCACHCGPALPPPSNQVEKEYPAGLAKSEILLVKMLRDSRPWADYMAITDALWNLRFRADMMKKEHEHLTANHGANSAP